MFVRTFVMKPVASELFHPSTLFDTVFDPPPTLLRPARVMFSWKSDVQTKHVAKCQKSFQNISFCWKVVRFCKKNKSGQRIWVNFSNGAVEQLKTYDFENSSKSWGYFEGLKQHLLNRIVACFENAPSIRWDTIGDKTLSFSSVCVTLPGVYKNRWIENSGIESVFFLKICVIQPRGFEIIL